MTTEMAPRQEDSVLHKGKITEEMTKVAMTQVRPRLMLDRALN